MSAKNEFYDEEKHARVTPVTRNRHSVYQVMQQDLQTGEVMELTRTPYKEVADEYINESIRALRAEPSPKTASQIAGRWRFWKQIIYIWSAPIEEGVSA